MYFVNLTKTSANSSAPSVKGKAFWEISQKISKKNVFFTPSLRDKTRLNPDDCVCRWWTMEECSYIWKIRFFHFEIQNLGAYHGIWHFCISYLQFYIFFFSRTNVLIPGAMSFMYHYLILLIIFLWYCALEHFNVSMFVLNLFW